MQFFYCFECDDVKSAFAYLATSEVCNKWNAITSKMVKGESCWKQLQLLLSASLRMSEINRQRIRNPFTILKPVCLLSLIYFIIDGDDAARKLRAYLFVCYATQLTHINVHPLFIAHAT